MTKLMVIIGPSAAGKSTVARALQAEGLIRIVPTWTDRPPRPGGHQLANHADHVFVNSAEFNRADARGDFLASATLPGLPYRYGLPRIHTNDAVSPAVIARCAQVDALEGLAARYGLDLVVIGIVDRDRRIEARLQDRNLPAAEIEARLAAAATERAATAARADHLVFNTGRLDQTVTAARVALPPKDGKRVRSAA